MRKRRTPQTPAPKLSHADGFANFAARVGHGTDQMTSQDTYIDQSVQFRNREFVTNIYSGSWMASTIVDSIAEDMTREGIESATLDERAVKALPWEAVTSALKWARLYGGALIFVDVVGQDPAMPLDPRTIKNGQTVRYVVFTRHCVTAEVGDLLEHTRFKRMEQVIHPSRCVVFKGRELPPFKMAQTQGWGGSILEPMYDRICAFDSASANVAQLINKLHLRMVGIKGFREALAMGGPAADALNESFDTMRYLQSSSGLTLLDADDAYSSDGASVAGVPDVVRSIAEQLSGASGIPMLRLFGQSPAGFSTGETDLQNYYDSVRTKQETGLRAQLLQLLAITHRQAVGQDLPADADFEFCSLWHDESVADEVAASGAIVAALSADAIDRKQAMGALQRLGKLYVIEDADVTAANDVASQSGTLPVPPELPAP